MPAERGQGCLCGKRDQVIRPSKYGFKRLNLVRSLWVSIHREATSKTIHRPELDKHCKTRIEEQQKNKKDFATRDVLIEGLLATSDKRLTRKTNFCCLSLFSVIFIDGLFQVLFSPIATKSKFSEISNFRLWVCNTNCISFPNMI